MKSLTVAVIFESYRCSLWSVDHKDGSANLGNLFTSFYNVMSMVIPTRKYHYQ